MLALIAIKVLKNFKWEQDNPEIQQCYSHNVWNPIKISRDSKKPKNATHNQD